MLARYHKYNIYIDSQYVGVCQIAKFPSSWQTIEMLKIHCKMLGLYPTMNVLRDFFVQLSSRNIYLTTEQHPVKKSNL